MSETAVSRSDGETRGKTGRQGEPVRPNRRQQLLRTTGGSAGTLAVAVVLLGLSVTAGLHLPATQYLSGYPAAAHLGSDRPPAGFLPLAQRFIARVLGLSPDDGGDPASASATARGGPDRSEGTRTTSPRLTVSHLFSNDAFESAYVVPTLPFTARTTTQSATRQPGEPTACAPVAGTAWYRYTAAADERLLALTLGSDYALALGVFTGDRMNDLVPVGCNNGPSGNAQVGFRATKGQTYYFQVTNIGNGGNLVFSLNPVGRTELMSISSSGEPSDSASYAAAASGDGRYVAFHSTASNLTPDQPRCPGGAQAYTTCTPRVFIHDRVSHATSLVSVSSRGEPANRGSFLASVSHDGRYVAFQSAATNLDPGVSGMHVYVRDRVTGITSRVSEPAAGGSGGGGSAPAISDDGRFVVFLSDARDLVGATRPPCQLLEPCPEHVFVRDRVTRTTTLVSEAMGGGYGNGGTSPKSGIQPTRPTISGDGRYVAFHSSASDLVPGDTNGVTDVFVRDLLTRRTERVSVSAAGEEEDGGSYGSSSAGRYVSADGRYIAFWSDATNLVADDTNDTSDFFVRDRVAGTTTRVSVSSAGAQGHAPPTAPTSTVGGVSLSGDGRVVAFDSALIDLADDAPAGPMQVYIRDLREGVTTIASVTSLGEPSNFHSMAPALSASGTVMAFTSASSNLVASDDNSGCLSAFNKPENCTDIFVHEPVLAQ